MASIYLREISQSGGTGVTPGGSYLATLRSAAACHLTVSRLALGPLHQRENQLPADHMLIPVWM